MTPVKRFMGALIRIIASRVLQYPRLRQLGFAVLKLLPGPVQGRLRRIAGPVAHMAPHTGKHPSHFPLSRRGEQIFLDLKGLRDSDGVAARITDPGEKPRLAFVSPLPPVRSGISDYSAELLPALTAWYRIELIVDQQDITDPHILASYPIHDVDWFRQHAGEFDRVLYQFGNALFHAHMFALLEEIPGVVVLHDFYLGHVVANMDAANYGQGYLAECLYEGHGYDAVRLYSQGEVQAAIWQYPCNFAVLQAALGVIVHSNHSLSLARQFYGETLRPWSMAPLLRTAAGNIDRVAARQRLELPADAFIVCTFGHLTPHKLSDRLLDAWLESQLARADNCLLVFVGESPLQGSGPALEARIKASGLKKRIHITGWVDTEHFHLWLRAADVGVQLRSMSRGETSAAALDCMNYGLATIVNGNGSMAALPDDAVLMLPDDFSNQELTAALETLWNDPALRLSLASRASALVRSEHSPDACARQYAEAIEQACDELDKGYGAKLHETLAALAPAGADDTRLITAAEQLAVTTPPTIVQRQLLVDVSALVRSDLKTGIERVARAQLLALINQPPQGMRVEPVYLTEHNGHWYYCYARRYASSLLNLHHFRVPDEVIDVNAGDILYVPDFYAHGIIHAHRDGLFQRLKAQGISITILVHDLLPITAPEFFPPGTHQPHSQWLAAISAFADRLICISRAVAADVRRLQQQAEHLPAIAVIHHGADIDASLPSKGFPRKAGKVLGKLASTPSFLMVGTIEPRKGHLQTLAAFDLLWEKGLDVNLVIIGNEGWKTLDDSQRRTIPQITRQLDLHPRRNKQLFWLEGISDDYLNAVYKASTCLIAASEGEGFGLPLIEAAQHGLPIIARDIPVFREVAGDHALYFSGHDPHTLAATVSHWLTLNEQGLAPNSTAMRWQTWSDNVTQLKRLLVAGDSLTHSPPERPRRGLVL